MLMYTHDCKTVFAGKGNPFIKALPFLQGYTPNKAERRFITRADLLALLSDGKEWEIPEIAASLHGNKNSIGATLLSMAEDGLICRDMRKIANARPGQRSIPVYSLWSTE